MRACGAIIAASLVAVGVSACTSGDARDAAAEVAQAFVSGVLHKHGGQACRMLTADARSSVVGATDSSCSQVILGIEESGAAVRGTQVWGDAAQVRIGTDVVFLRDVDGQWRVSGAGCTRQPAGPYDCEAGG
jgi:hypothetical protein